MELQLVPILKNNHQKRSLDGSIFEAAKNRRKGDGSFNGRDELHRASKTLEMKAQYQIMSLKSQIAPNGSGCDLI